MSFCKNCGNELNQNGNFCTKCGMKVEKAVSIPKNYCTNCGAEIKEYSDICLNCGMLISKQESVNDEKNYNVLSICGFVVSIISLFFGLLGLILEILAMIMGVISLNQLKNNDKEKGQVFSILSIVIACSYIIFYLLIMATIVSYF